VCFSVLQCVAVCCSVLQCVAVCCSVLQCVAVRCSVLQCETPYTVTVQCSAKLTSHHSAVRCSLSLSHTHTPRVAWRGLNTGGENLIHRKVVCCIFRCQSICAGMSDVSVLQCVAVCCNVLQCVAVCCSVLQCVAVCCSARPSSDVSRFAWECLAIIDR